VCRDIVRFTLILFWVIRVTYSLLIHLNYWFSSDSLELLVLFWVYSSEPFHKFSVSGLVSVTGKCQNNCARSTSFHEASNNRSLCERSTIFEPDYLRRPTITSNSKSHHMYINIYIYIYIYIYIHIYVYIYISYLNRGFLFYYIRAPIGFCNSINPRVEAREGGCPSACLLGKECLEKRGRENWFSLISGYC